MPNNNAPRGAQPLRMGQSGPYTGGDSPYLINSGFASAIGQGDVVKLTTSGYIAPANAGDQFRGVFVGAIYTDALGRPQRTNYWPAGQTTQNSVDATALVIDDPAESYVMQFDAAAASGQQVQNKTFNILYAAPSAADGLSRSQLAYSTLSVAAQQFRVLRFLQRVDNDTATTQAFAKVEVVPALQDFRVNTGS